MWQAVLAVAVLQTMPAQSRFAVPVSAAEAAVLARIETAALFEARRAVAELKRLARTPVELRFAQHTARIFIGIESAVRDRRIAREIGAAAGRRGDPLLNTTKRMQETQMAFNLQYLQLQSQMQHESRSYTAISNIMKTKHDTVKNSISNIR